METLINKNSVIDTPVELLFIILIAFLGIILLFNIGNFIENLPVAGRKAKSQVVKEKTKEVNIEINKKVNKEVTKEVKEKSTYISAEDNMINHTSDTSYVNTLYKERDDYYSSSSLDCSGPMQMQRQGSRMYNDSTYNPQGNYLYDRFVDNPTDVDKIKDKKISDNFISDKDYEEIKNTQTNIKTTQSDVVGDKTKESLYSRIQEMTSSNNETRERLLNEFEGLSREMKLLIIDNIIQKM